MRVIWKPQPKQAQFMERWEDEALYGGAAGGGKSEALVLEALRQVHIPEYRALILRKTYPELSELIEKSEKYYPRIVPGCKFTGNDHSWRFPSGAKIIFGAMHHAKDRVKYQGRSFSYIAFDELTHFTADEYMYLLSRNRSNAPGIRNYIRATANPGGVGHGWVKDRFVSAATPMTTIHEPIRIMLPDGSTMERDRTRIFVPAAVFDNPALLEANPDYVASLASMPEAERKALLYGDWDSFSGQVFTEWRNNPDHYADRRGSHVIDPFRIEGYWKIIRCFDWGYNAPSALLWIAFDTEGRMYVVREYYAADGANVGARMTVPELAAVIRRIEEEDENLRGKTIRGVADPAIWQEDGGISIAEQFERCGVYWDRGDHSRIPGKMQLHYRLQFNDMGIPMLYVFGTCRNLIRTFPSLVYSIRDVEDVDTTGEDHLYDALRYGAMEQVIAQPPQRRTAEPQDDPLNLWKDRWKYR